MAYTYGSEAAAEKAWDERCKRLEATVDNMTADELMVFVIDANDDELCDLLNGITAAAIDRDWPGVEARTKQLIQAIKDYIPFTNAR